MAGEFTVTGFAAQRLPDGADAGSVEEQSPLEGLTGRFVSNIPAGKAIPVSGGLLYVPPRDWIIDSLGRFREVLPDGTTSTAIGITLTADDPDFELGAALQWEYVPGRFTMAAGRTFQGTRATRLAAFWFNAQDPGWAGTIDVLTPVPGVDQPGGTKGSRGLSFGGLQSALGGTAVQSLREDGVPVGPTVALPSAAWGSIAGRPAVVAGGVDALAARKAVDAALDYPVDVPIVISTNAETNATNDKTLVGTSRVPYLVQVDATNIKLVFANYTYSSGSQADQTPTTDMVIGGAALEYAGAITKVTFAGQYGVTIKPGGQVTSDPISIDVIAGTYLNVRTFTPSGTWHSVRYAINAAAAAGGFTATTDLTAAGSAAIADGANVHLAGPIQVLGTPIARSNFSGVIRRPRVAIIGNSIVNGHNDAIYNAGMTGWNATFPGLGRGGWVDRAAQAYGFLVLKLGMPGYTAQKALNTPASRQFSYAQINKASNLIWSLGVNDINAGRTLAQLQADLIALWTIQASQGKRCFALTLTPIANSTDIFQTLANQSVLSGESVRVAYNTWLRDGAPMINGAAVATGTTGATVSRANYLTGNTVTVAASGPAHPLYGTVEFTNTVESAQNSGKWKIPYSTRQVNDVVATAGNYFFISNTAALASPADVGKKVYISGAGAGGAGLLTSIVSISGPTQPLIADPIVTSVNPQVGIIYDPLTTDGIHPGPSAHEALKTAVPYSHFL